MTTTPATLTASFVLTTCLTTLLLPPLLPCSYQNKPEKQPVNTPVAPAPASNPVSEPPVTAPPDGKRNPDQTTRQYATVEELLAALETADKDLRTLTADLTYDNIAGDIEGGDRQSRRGKVSFRNQPATPPPPADAGDAAPKPALPAVPPIPAPQPVVDAQPKPKVPEPPGPTAKPAAPAGKAFAVTFDTRLSDNKRFVEARTFILNEGVLVEKLANEKRINRYKLGGGAAKIDPLKIGEGPFPIPFGQKPADITARFDVSLLPGLTDVRADDPGARKTFDETYQLRLVPKASTKAAKEFSEARIWFAKKDLFPIMARTSKIGGGSDEFRLINIRLNTPIEDVVFSTTTPDGWTVEEKEMR